MVTLLLDRTRLEVELSPIERAVTFQRGNLHIERSAITKVQLTDDAWTWLRGIRAPGTHIPGVLAAGTWQSASGKDFVLIRRRRPSVVIDLVGAEYERLILTTRHGLALAQALRLDVSEELAEVTEIAATGPVRVPGKGRAGKPAIRPAGA
ncbi:MULTISPECIES: hypothetical protein [Microbacterium]|uniref:Uncharacterized protein n=1 Tax=Microbacterium resistens TaxID=156977 RepID=A0ABY3RSX0_9MICO|nr:hypothetical protein [Microbacterium resistens]MBW1638854.1 hypothetical protein [Microbacterium resistens]MDA4892219.1 hypothetical protein [Streptomyces sp. MS2A]UGS25984.1 hypothetical protein K8F61_15240 [Microbacterium resistens]